MGIFCESRATRLARTAIRIAEAIAGKGLGGNRMVMAIITGVVVGIASGNALAGIGAGIAWMVLVMFMDRG